MDRRTAISLTALLPATAVAGASTASAAPASKTGAFTPPFPLAYAEMCIDCGGSGSIANLAELERAFAELSQTGDEEVQEMVAQIARRNHAAVRQDVLSPTFLRVPLPGPAALVQCALSAAWIFRKGANSSTICMQVAEVVVACVGIPAASWVVLKVARLVWDNRRRIAAALSAIGLTAAQLAPLTNARRP